VTFWNEPVIGELKVCTIAETGDINGLYFSFTEQAGITTFGPFSVQAEPPGAPMNCSNPTSYPIGTKVTVSESGISGVFVSDISGNVSGITVGGGYGCEYAGDGGSAVVPVGNAGTTIVDFTNAAPTCGPPTTGYLEACQQAGDASVGSGPWTFTISGNGEPSQTESVLTGQCSGDVPLPVGNYTVTETLAPPDSVSAITGSPNLPVSVDLGNASGVFAVSQGIAETADFTDAAETAEFKICTEESSPDANLAGQTFTYEYSITDDGVTAPGSDSFVEASSPGVTCSGLITGIPYENPDGTIPSVSITAEPPTAVGVDLVSVSCGRAITPPPPSLPATFPFTVSFPVGAGANGCTFVNGRTSAAGSGSL
jgi:hypothetical protein